MSDPAGHSRRNPSAATVGMRKRQPRGDLRRRQIIDAAVDLFATKGYRSTGVQALADRVGMTAPGLLYYFGTKEGLLREVVAERDRADTLDPGVAESLAGLRDLGKHNVETALLTRLYVVLGAESLEPDEPLHDFFVARYETARQLARSLLEAERSAGRLRPDVEIPHLAQEIIAVIMGLEIQWLIDPDAIDLEAGIRKYIDRLLHEISL